LKSSPPRSYTSVAIAIVIAGLVIGAGIFASSYLVAQKTAAVTTVSSSVHTVISVSTYTAYSSPSQPPTIGGATAANITVGGSPSSAAIDSSTNLIYVTNGQNLNVISGGTGKVVGNITLGASLLGLLAVDAQTDTLYLNNGSCPPCSASVIALNGTTGKEVASVDLGVYVDGLTVNPDTGIVYAISADNGMLYAINGTTNALVANVTLPGPAFHLAVDPNTNTVYVAACTSSTISLACTVDLYAINGSTLSLTDMGPADADASGTMAVNPVTNILYIVSGNTLVSVNTTTRAPTFTLLSAFPMSCNGLALDQLDNYIFVSCDPRTQQLPSLFILNGQDNQVLNSFTVSGSPAGVVFDGGAGSAFLVDQNGYVLQLLSTYAPLP
jgi:DNA-binding beta-propeller fold protein YncE